MDTSQFLHGQADRMECWDDDPDFAGIDPTFTQPLPTSSPKNNKRTSLDNRDRRESISSRMSMQSSSYDFDSPESGDHERQVLLDESPAAAIASAINAGIPIPENVPSSALIGGTIKRLGTTKKARKIATHDDWGEDLELPISGMSLKVRGQGGLEFPDTLQQILSESRPPSRTNVILPQSASAQLNKYREVEDGDDFFADTDDLPTPRLSPARHTLQQQKSNASLLLTPPLSESATRGSPSVDDDFENDFEFPADAPLQLNIKTGESNRHQVQVLDSDSEDWAEGGSLGTRFGGTSRLGSSIISPSVSSVAAESEDEAPLDGLELPSGNLPDLAVILERQKRASYPMDASTSFETKEDLASKEEFFEGIEIGEGEEVFDSRKLTLNRNVKHKPSTRKTSPVRRSAMSLTFTTNKSATESTPSAGTGSRSNRLLHGHPTLAPPIPILEPVAERENQPAENISSTSTTTNAQLLRMKRSMPNIGRAAVSTPAKQPRPPSRSSAGRPPSSNSQGRPPSSRPASRNESSRSKVSGDRMDIGAGRKPSVPFLPAGSSVRQSQHISAKRSRQTFDYKESIAAERRTNSRLQQRTPRHSPSSSTASAKAKRATPTVAPEHLRREAAAIETLTQPTRKRNFGDGTELEIFDDLPTSAKLENRFVVAPAGRGAPEATKSRSVPVHGTTGRDGESPSKRIDLTNRFGEVPRFARDTNASRNAREQRTGHPPGGGANPSINHWKAQVAARGTAGPKSRRKPQQKPHLIKPMGNVNSLPKVTAVNGMTYNPKTYKWEGNEGDVKGFETQNPTPPRPALIANVNQNGSKLGIQVVRGMVFDPSRMCWLKVDEDPDEEEHDPFEGLDDLQDHDMISIDRYSGGMDEGFGGNVFGGSGSGAGVGGPRGTRLSGGFGEFIVGEEFDVGPEFVRRQREEEERWRRRVEGWVSQGEASKLGNKWALRELLADQR
ncbi:unnamed protein product [Tuber melanosporum]|uniref:(Perigord truffle) hypothetical protein n=1 Tax=Tuber melanosporum (strain Mel28) TaxID=656061 RepID=D5GK55_TUBMM|nr:uncharacterized protein GSTUM_00009369001 [Tuber melanosporum]CAZ84898.1 unnamed protein product [Tuber melanosporum]